MEARLPATPPASPPKEEISIHTSSILHPADQYQQASQEFPVYEIDGSTLASAIQTLATQPLPEPKQVFPWMHGLHSDNQVQLTFFSARRKPRRVTPKCLRGLTIVKVGGDLSRSRLKGAVAPDELFSTCLDADLSFLECDPKEGFSVRNFQIQAAKMAMVSDIVVYGDESATVKDVIALAESISKAQESVKQRSEGDEELQSFNTFVLSSK